MLMDLALKQEPSPEDGIRYSKAGIIRNTYAELKTTTLETWKDFFPEESCGAVVHGAPITHHIKIPGFLDFMVLFVSADRPKDVKKLLSLELSFLWFNEFREIERPIFTAGTDRIGRYPSLKHHGVFATRDCVICDTNPPDEESWQYDLELESPEGHEFFHQPPAIWPVDEIPEGIEYNPKDLIETGGRQYLANPHAENKPNLKPGYYESKVPGKTHDWIRVYYQSKYGYVADGKPVIPNYDDTTMSREDLPILQDQPLLVGIDIGGGTLSPAAIIGQRHPRGVWMIHAEVVPGEMGLERFSDAINYTLATIFDNRKIDKGWGDPAGRNRDPLFEVAILQHMRNKGIPIWEAPTNAIKARIEAITAPMGRYIDGQPGFLIHKRCKKLRSGLAAKWKYKKIQVVGPERFAATPDKNEYSHPCDGLGYLLLGGGENQQMRGRKPGKPAGKTRNAYKPPKIF
uniref:Terminase large subunit n=1 Tax=uncultured marine virus TaxID=186617 RepID=A0A0F7L719_9VIRU|nr:hypothetical protein DVVG_00034 [uncultured marine virus]